MRKFYSANDPVLPRPLEKLPEYAHAKSRRALAERLVAAFCMSEVAADAIANAVVDPSAVRKSIGEPSDPQVEDIAVPGGTLQGIRTTVWSRRVMPDPRNPRIGPSRRHPFAVDPGAGGEDSRFRPVPEPRSPDGKPPTVPELVVDIESRHHLEWASAQAEVMRRAGDPIERYLVDFVEPLHRVLYPYAGIWADHVLLDVHDAVPGFWEHIGSAIDNLALCFDEWGRFLNEMGDAWEHLRNWLPNEDKDRPVVQAVGMPTPVDPDAYARMLTDNWGNLDAPSTIKITDPLDAIKTIEVKPINLLPDIPPSGTR